MTTATRIFVNVLADDLATSRDFYLELLGFEVLFEADWYVQVSPGGDPERIVGLWRRDHDLVPVEYRKAPQGVILTIVVDNVDEVHLEAVRRGIHIVRAPENQIYGQRSMLVLDPSGLLVDISTPVR